MNTNKSIILLFALHVISLSYSMGDDSIFNDIDDSSIVNSIDFSGLEFMAGIGYENSNHEFRLDKISSLQNNIAKNSVSFLIGFGSSHQTSDRIFMGVEMLFDIKNKSEIKNLSDSYKQYDDALKNQNSEEYKAASQMKMVDSPYFSDIGTASSYAIYLKFGYAPEIAPILLFVKIGAAFNKQKFRIYGKSKVNPPINVNICDESINRIDPSIGFGIEKKISKALSLRLHYAIQFGNDKTITDSLHVSHKVKLRRKIGAILLCWKT